MFPGAMKMGTLEPRARRRDLTPICPDKSALQIVTVGASFLSTFYVRPPFQTCQSEASVADLTTSPSAMPGNYLGAYTKFASGRRHDLVVVFTVPSDVGMPPTGMRGRLRDRQSRT